MNINEYSPLALAYLGDAVFEILTRETIVRQGQKPVNKLHNASKRYVNAKSQSKMFNAVFELAKDEEREILRRGRNAKPNSVAKNFSVYDYKKATALETLFGYLKLTDNDERLRDIFQICVDALEEPTAETAAETGEKRNDRR
jgi:ribonuclease-3 family protein